MQKEIVICCLLIFSTCMRAQVVRYSTAWFGPNANPVPEFTDASIPMKTTLKLSADYYFGFGDRTKNIYATVEVPLLANYVSLKVWSSFFESYQTTQNISLVRNTLNGNNSGTAVGDLYVQTRILLISEKKTIPAIILNSTLKTASGSNFQERRYFDTPGYYFDLEFGKSVFFNNSFLKEMRTVANIGFMCWETTNSVQNDAPMYGAKIILGNEKWKLENTLSGYWGWMHTNANYGSDYGDAPLVYATKLSIRKNKSVIFAQYQYGIKDFPYHQIRMGISLELEKLTPNYPIASQSIIPFRL